MRKSTTSAGRSIGYAQDRGEVDVQPDQGRPMGERASSPSLYLLDELTKRKTGSWGRFRGSWNLMAHTVIPSNCHQRLNLLHRPSDSDVVNVAGHWRDMVEVG